MLKNFFLKHKKIIYLALFIFIIIILSFFPRPASPPAPTPSPTLSANRPQSSSYTPPFYTQPAEPDSPAVQTAAQTKQQLQSILPIYIPDFPTSVNLPTTINLYTLSSDPNYLIHLDIYGIDYQNQSLDETTNPNLTAFKESFLRAKQELQNQNIDITDLYFICGNRQFIQQTAEKWINHLNLL